MPGWALATTLHEPFEALADQLYGKGNTTLI
jgi:hypothetical protein